MEAADFIARIERGEIDIHADTPDESGAETSDAQQVRNRLVANSVTLCALASLTGDDAGRIDPTIASPADVLRFTSERVAEAANRAGRTLYPVEQDEERMDVVERHGRVIERALTTGKREALAEAGQ